MASFRRIPGIGHGSRRSVGSDVDAEIRAHLDETVAQLVASGWSEGEAREEALRRFGDVVTTRDVMTHSALRQHGRMRRRDRIESWMTDLRYAARILRRSPGLALTVVVTLGLGIGASTAMFAFLDRLLLRPPPGVQEAEAVRRVYLTTEDRGLPATVTEVSLLRLRELQESAGESIELAGVSETPVIVGRGPDASNARGAFVTASFWPLLGVRPVLGRLHEAGDEVAPQGSASVVLGYPYWISRFGGDSGVIGQTIPIGARTFTIVGVAAAGFEGIGATRVDLWMPAATASAVHSYIRSDWIGQHGFSWLSLIVRPRPEVTPPQAEQRLGLAHRSSLLGQGDTARASASGASLWPLLIQRGPERDDSTRVAIWLGAVALLVLLLACANVANLLLARSIERRGEIGLRLALGINRWRLVRQLFLESLLLGASGVLVGVLISRAAVTALSVFLTPVAAAAPVDVDARILAFAAVIGLMASLLSGLGPVAYAVGADVRGLLGGLREGRRPSRMRGALLIGQTALSTVLLVVAGLFVRSLDAAQSTRLGFEADELLTVRLRLLSTEPLPGGTSVLYRQLAEAARGITGIASATTTLQVPFSVSSATEIDVPGVDSAARFGQYMYNSVGEDYFPTTGTRILRGRPLTATDRAGSPRVLVVSDSMARVLWPGRDPIGQCVRVGGSTSPCSEVVGVAENIHQYDLRPEPVLQYWFPASQNQAGSREIYAVLVRTRGDAARMAVTVREALQAHLPASVHMTVAPIGTSVARVLRPWRMGATLFSAFGALGLAIAAVGLFSLLAYGVSQRQREFGVRLALGAGRAALVVMVLRQGVLLALGGIAAGLALCAAGAGRIAPLLLGIGPRDPFVIGAVAFTLTATAVLAAAIPAWRAARVNPTDALRAE
jgi:predicted permease